MKSIIASALVLSTLVAPLAQAESAAQSVEAVRQMSAADALERMQKMSPQEREALFNAYDRYLYDLSAKLEDATARLQNVTDSKIELQISKYGLIAGVAGTTILLPSLLMTPSKLVIVSFFGQLGERVGGAIMIGGGLVAATALAVYGGRASVPLAQVYRLQAQISIQRKQLAKLRALLNK